VVEAAVTHPPSGRVGPRRRRPRAGNARCAGVAVVAGAGRVPVLHAVVSPNPPHSTPASSPARFEPGSRGSWSIFSCRAVVSIGLPSTHPHSFTRWRGGRRYLPVYSCSRCCVPVKCVKVCHRLRLLCQPVRRRWHALVASRSWWVAELVYRVASEDAVSPAKRSIWQSVLGTGPFRPVALGWHLAWLRWGIKGMELRS
jgi:hypothetical protein